MQIPSFNLICALLLLQPSPQPFSQLPPDGARIRSLSLFLPKRPTAQQAPCLSQSLSAPGRQLSLHTSLNVRNMFSAPTASSFCMCIPLLPTCCWLWKRNKSEHEWMCRALCSSRGVNLSKSPALAKAFFPLQCQCCFAAHGPSCAGTGTGTQGLEGLLSSLSSASCFVPSDHPSTPAYTASIVWWEIRYLLVLKPEEKLLLPETS